MKRTKKTTATAKSRQERTTVELTNDLEKLIEERLSDWSAADRAFLGRVIHDPPRLAAFMRDVEAMRELRERPIIALSIQ